MDLNQLKEIMDSNELPKYKLQKDYKLQLPSIKKSINLTPINVQEIDNDDDKLEVDKI
jgi:hypothetical protein